MHREIRTKVNKLLNSFQVNQLVSSIYDNNQYSFTRIIKQEMT